jgi:DNA-binding Lrp family transcriptional regulator
VESIDRALIHALTVDGRAPFRRIAGVLGVSDQTVARRYHRLRRTGRLRVVGRLDPRCLGRVEEWMFRLQCTPRAALPVARALAKRADTYWVRLAAGGGEIVSHMQAPSHQARDALLLDKLPATRQITAITAHRVLRVFRGGPTIWQAPASALTADQIHALTPSSGEPAREPRAPDRVDLDDEDRVLLHHLALDGRMHHAALAAATGWHESTVRRRITHLRAAGALYFGVDFDEELFGFTSHTILWISVAPARLAAVGTALAGHAEIAYAAATTGPANLLASALCTDSDAFYTYLTERLGALPGIRHLETAPVIRVVKRAATVDPATGEA